MSETALRQVELIPIDQIYVLNPRSRGQAAFAKLVQSISKVGLKRPVTVSKRKAADGLKYNLVCGQGRIEAFQILGQTEIPAIVKEAEETDCLVMSLVENIARRHLNTMELLHDIKRLDARGTSAIDIAERTGLSADYVRGVIKLIKNGEERLIEAVDAGDMPLSVAIDIADSNHKSIQNVLSDAYEQGLLKGRKLLAAKRLIERRYESSRDLRPPGKKPDKPLTTNELVRTYEEAAERQRVALKRAEHANASLAFIVGSLRVLLRDEHFLTLLRAENLVTVPGAVGEMITQEAAE